MSGTNALNQQGQMGDTYGMRYRLKTGELRKRAIDAGYPATGIGIALAVGIHPWTLSHLVSGKPPSAKTMATLVAGIGCRTDDIFSIVPDDTTGPDPEDTDDEEEAA